MWTNFSISLWSSLQIFLDRNICVYYDLLQSISPLQQQLARKNNTCWIKIRDFKVFKSMQLTLAAWDVRIKFQALWCICCLFNFLFTICVVMTTYVVHTARRLRNADLQDWLEDGFLSLVTDEEQLITNQNEGLTAPRKDRKATRYQPGEEIQDNTQRTSFLIVCCLSNNDYWVRWTEEHRRWHNLVQNLQSAVKSCPQLLLLSSFKHKHLLWKFAAGKVWKL